MGGRGAGGAEHLQGRHSTAAAVQSYMHTSGAELYLEKKMTKMHQFMQQGNKAVCLTGSSHSEQHTEGVEGRTHNGCVCVCV